MSREMEDETVTYQANLDRKTMCGSKLKMSLSVFSIVLFGN
jgi:hypothetical protein